MKKYLDLLKTVSLFEGIGVNEIETVLSCLSAEIVSYGKKQAVFLEGDSVGKVGIVLSGSVEVVKEDFYGNKNIVALLSEGQLFGETFVCSDIKEMPVSVICVTDCVIMLIDYRKLVTTCSNACAFHGNLVKNMLRIVANKNILLNQKLEFITKRTTREKLLAYLSAQAKKAGSSSFCIPLNRQQLADYLAVERSAMSAELSKLKKDGVIDYKKNCFKLL